MTTPNRLETHWEEIKPLILKKWDRLTLSDFDSIDCEFDRLVEVIRQRYNGPVYTVSEENIRYEVLKMLAGIEAEAVQE
ncbi:MAG: hypothetical protein HQM15_02735 [Deltaproteobacteria bacterium]|nr:hypothetical protein [Deltaproteobacteria bacterium]